MDLVIAVDCSLAHLAGALNLPVWIPLQAAVEWRWGIESPTTPWYPSARLFRQQRVRKWGPVFAQMAPELRELGAPACGSGVAPTGQLSGASVGQVIPSILTPQRSTLLHRGCSRGVPYPCSPQAGLSLEPGLSSRARKAYGLFPNQLGATGGEELGEP
jgi:hypothetical protein